VGIALPCGILPIENLAWANKPIRTMDDFKGLKFRTSGWWGEILSNAGASVVMLPGGEVYEALQRRVIDAGEFSIPSMDKDLAFYEIAKYVLGPGVHQITTMLEIVVNEKSWKSLPPDLQAIVKAASQATTLNMLTDLINADMAAVEFLKGKGVQFFHLDPEVQKALKKQAYALIDEKAEKDAFTKEVWESQKKFMAAYNAYRNFTEVQTD
jgi:TRAP-type mannitol/chloroaromatic compound transport system substrate-binding protein